jgi:hypothetical protein
MKGLRLQSNPDNNGCSANCNGRLHVTERGYAPGYEYHRLYRSLMGAFTLFSRAKEVDGSENRLPAFKLAHFIALALSKINCMLKVNHSAY